MSNVKERNIHWTKHTLNTVQIWLSEMKDTYETVQIWLSEMKDTYEIQICMVTSVFHIYTANVNVKCEREKLSLNKAYIKHSPNMIVWNERHIWHSDMHVIIQICMSYLFFIFTLQMWMYVLEEKPYNVSTCYVSSTPFEEMTLDSLLSKNCTTWPVHIRHPHMIGHTLYHMTSSHTTPSYDWSYSIWQPPCDWLYVMWPVHMSQGHLSGGIKNYIKMFHLINTDFELSVFSSAEKNVWTCCHMRRHGALIFSYHIWALTYDGKLFDWPHELKVKLKTTQREYILIIHILYT